MNTRLPTAILVSGLIRAIETAGGNAMVLARGDRDSGAVLFVVAPAAMSPMVWERGFDTKMMRVGPVDGSDASVTEYWSKRRRNDPDLWVIEANVAGAERFAEETVFAN